MRVMEQVDAFFGRKRPLRYIAVALLLAALGHLLESRTAMGWVAEGQALTRSIDAQLHAVQPFAIADHYSRATVGRRGLPWCATGLELSAAREQRMAEALRNGMSIMDADREARDARPPGKSECTGWSNMLRGAVTTVLATPAVGIAVWREGGWVNRLLLPLTVLGVITALVGLWRGADGNAPLPQTIGVLAIGPFLMGGVFWLALWVLFALVWAFGNVLAGLGWIIATFAGVYKVVAFCIGILKSSDGIADQRGLLATPAPPPSPTNVP